jgi:hypothetical protein
LAFSPTDTLAPTIVAQGEIRYFNLIHFTKPLTQPSGSTLRPPRSPLNSLQNTPEDCLRPCQPVISIQAVAPPPLSTFHRRPPFPNPPRSHVHSQFHTPKTYYVSDPEHPRPTRLPHNPLRIWFECPG